MTLPTSMREAFNGWLINGNAKGHTPDVVITCMDKVSEYALSKKILRYSLWEIKTGRLFKSIYQQLREAKLLRIANNEIYTNFLIAGQLYLKFLKEKAFATAGNNVDTKVPDNTNKIGVYVRTKLQQLSKSGFIFSEQQLKELSDLQWCRVTFKLAAPHPCVKMANGITPLSELIKDEYGYNRYWNEIFVFGDVNLVFTSQWYERNRLYFDKWFLSLGANDKVGKCARATYPIDNEYKVKQIISKFKNGYRISSNIDFERFLNFYVNEYGEAFVGNIGDIDIIMTSIAVIFDDRAYIYDDNVVDIVRLDLEQMGSPCIYISAFFEKFSEKLYALGIFSVDILNAFIKKNYNDIFCKRNYVYLQPDVSPSNLIRLAFDERETWALYDLFDRLPYLKQDTISQTLNSVGYHRIDMGIYTHVDNMDLPDSEGKKVAMRVEEQLQNKSYVTANELDLSQFEHLNPHCPFSTIRDAVFNKFLSTHYSKSGQVITRIGEKLRVIDIIEQYCRAVETVSFNELNAFEASFGKGTHSQCLIAAHNVMLRVSDDLFVSESNVSFDVDRIDEVLALYCGGDFIPLKGITDFSLFPYVGYPWNLFLLESYLRKLSSTFKYDVRAVNSSNIGVIVRKTFIYQDYDDILAIALAKTSIFLDDRIAIGDFLFNNGYIGRRDLGKNEGKIISNAKKLRKVV